jgi:hypothetical protein
MRRLAREGARTRGGPCCCKHIAGPFTQDWNNDSKNQQNRPKHHALGRSREIAMAPATSRIPSTETCRAETMQGDACNGGMAMLPRIFLAWLEQIQQSFR